MVSIRKRTPILALCLALLLFLMGCSTGSETVRTGKAGSDTSDTGRYLRIIGEEPVTADPQCTVDQYCIPLNVFDRLVEVEAAEDGTVSFAPSLAESWEVSEDGLIYTFHLRKGVTFSNGSSLTSSDVEYTLIRAITHPDSRAGDIGAFILGADDLKSGKTEKLAGFRTLSDRDFTITLAYPYAALISMLSIPQYSILDQETTVAAEDAFGTEPQVTVGTGPFIFQQWHAGREIILTANPKCWSGAPGCDGILVQFVSDPEARRILFETGKLDILDLENLGVDAEYFIRGREYQDQLYYGNRVGLTYIALNGSVEPLNDVRVRRALQLALDRNAILMSIYIGRGSIENGIFPHGLIGFDPELPEIPYDPEAAQALLAEAGYPDGFDLEITVNELSQYYSREIMEMAAHMWGKIGIRTNVRPVEDSRFMEARRNGELACYSSRFSVGYNDPDAIIYVFFGSEEDSRDRSLCYANGDIIDRVAEACSIVDEDERIREYRELERIIVQVDCAWIPLFSNLHYFVVNDRVKNFRVPWNGWSDTRYRDVVIEDYMQ